MSRSVKFGSLNFGPRDSGDIQVMIEQAQRKERIGFDYLWMPDHILAPTSDGEVVDAWTTLTYVASRTDKIIVGQGVTDPLRSHPAQLALQIATLDKYTKGRVVLGIGAGEAMNLVPFSIPLDHSVSRLEEAIKVLKLLFSADLNNPAEFSGTYFNLSNAFLQVKAHQKPHPPIYVGALGKRNREMSGRLADGVFTFINTPKTFAERLVDIRRGAESAGRSISELDVTAYIIASIDEDKEKARKSASLLARSFLNSERDTLIMMGFDAPLSEDFTAQKVLVSSETIRISREAVEKIPREAVDMLTVTGGAKECIDGIESFIRSGATQIVIRDTSPDTNYSAKVLKDTVIPAFR